MVLAASGQGSSGNPMLLQRNDLQLQPRLAVGPGSSWAVVNFRQVQLRCVAAGLSSMRS